MRLPSSKKITSDNMSEEVQPAVDMIGGILNVFMDDVVSVLNGNVDFDNLAFRIVSVEVIVDASGNVKTSPELNVGLNRPIRGSICINVKSSLNNVIPPDITGTPFVTFNTLENGRIKITKVLNLKENKKYILTLLVV